MQTLGSPVVIDGSHGEGGAALIRTALAMSSVTQQAVRIEYVRGSMPQTGLKPEDLAILRVLALATAAEVVGAEVGSTSVSFLPTRQPKGAGVDVAIPEDMDGPGVANALVILNALLPVMARTGVYTSLSAVGETYGTQTLSYDYWANVTLGAHRRAGLYAYPSLVTAGFGRKARGEVTLDVEPSAIGPFEWGKRGKLRSCRAVVAFAEVTDNVGDRGVSHLARLAFHSKLKLDSEAIRVKSTGPGAFVTVWAEFDRGIGGATAMGARGVRIESVVQNAFDAFMRWCESDATVDAFLADQLLITAALASGPSTFTTPNVTERLMTAAWVIKQFMPIHITVRGQVGSPGVVTVSR